MNKASRLATSTTKTEATTNCKAFVTLRFAGDDLDPAQISAILPIAPTRAHRTGEEFFAGPHAGTLRGRTGAWFLSTDKLVPDDRLGHHLKFIEKLLRPPQDHRRRIVRLRDVLVRTHSNAHVTCFWRGEPGETPPQNPQVVPPRHRPARRGHRSRFRDHRKPVGWVEQSETHHRRPTGIRWVSLRSTHPTR